MLEMFITGNGLKREKHSITLKDGDYYALITVSDRAKEISDEYISVLLSWAQNIWDWEAVETLENNRGEDIHLATRGRVCYTLSKEDLQGLFGGKYGGSPGPLPGYLDDPDSWENLQAEVWIPLKRFSTAVQAELKEAV